MNILNLETREEFSIEIFKNSGEEKMTCPACSHTRKKKHLKCFSWNHGKNVGYCSHCNITFVPVIRSEKKQYKKPEWKNNTELSESVVKWFESRGISQFTLREMKVTESVEFMPQTGKNANTINFNYFKNGELINIKYRDGAKNFKLHKNSELIFYNYDGCVNSDVIIIVEGEIDALTLCECGIWNVLSVPNGAAMKGDVNLEFIDNCIELFATEKKIIIATDNDIPGINLRNSLAARLGIENCYRINMLECKDINEFLLKYGKQAVVDVIEGATPFPIEGIFTSTDFVDELYNLYERGMPPAYRLGLGNFDDLISFDFGKIYTITGIPGHGKSEFLDELAVRLNLIHDLKIAYFSPENFPLELHAAKIFEKISGKTFSPEYLKKKSLDEIAEHYKNNFFHILPENDFTVDTVLARARGLIKSKGIKVLVIDPYNTLEHQRGNDNEHEYVSKFMSKLQMFAKMNQIILFLVAHPKKINKMGNGFYEVPTMYDISGSSHFFNKTDFGICVYRNFDENTTSVYVQKVKFKHLGSVGFHDFRWNFKNGRYSYFSHGTFIDDNESYMRFLKNKHVQIENVENTEFDVQIENENDIPF